VSDGSGQASYGVPSDDLENRLTERYWGKLGPGGNILEAGIVLQPPKTAAVSAPAEAEAAA